MRQKFFEALKYDPETGKFSWAEEPGCIAGNGYRYIQVAGKKRLAHRVAWHMHYGVEPDGLIDHINGDRSDNRIENLRVVDYSQNGANAAPRSRRNGGGLKGASFMPKRSKWQSSITVRGKQMMLGYFNTEQEAHEAYMNAAHACYGDYASNGRREVSAFNSFVPGQLSGALSFGA